MLGDKRWRIRPQRYAQGVKFVAAHGNAHRLPEDRSGKREGILLLYDVRNLCVKYQLIRFPFFLARQLANDRSLPDLCKYDLR